MINLHDKILLLLVKNNGRDAAILFEDSIFPEYRTAEYKKELCDYAIRNHLFYRFDGGGRMLVTREEVKGPLSDEVLAGLLGYYCKGHNYGDQGIDRLGLSLYVAYKGQKIQIYAEYCEASRVTKDALLKHGKAMLPRWRQALGASYKISMKTDYEYSQQSKLRILQTGDDDAVDEIRDQVVSDLDNAFGGNTNAADVLERRDYQHLDYITDTYAWSLHLQIPSREAHDYGEVIDLVEKHYRQIEDILFKSYLTQYK